MILEVKIIKTKILQLLVLMINPFMSFILSLLFMFNRQKISILYLSIAISIIIVYLPLAPDVAANFFHYLNSTDYNELLTNKGLYLAVPKLLYQYSDLQYITTLFLYLVFILYVWFLVFEFYAFKVKKREYYYYILIFALFSLIELRLTGLNKNILSISLIFLFLFLHEVQYKHNILVYLLVPVSILMHPIALSFIFIYLAAIILKSQKLYFAILIVSIIGMFSMLSILEYFLSKLSLYGSIVWIDTLDYYIHSSAHGFVPMVGSDLQIRVIELPFLLMVYYMGINLLKVNNSILIRFILLVISVSISFFFMHSFYERYSISSYIFSAFIIYKYASIERMKLKQILLIIVTIFVIFRFFYLNVYYYGYIYDDQGYSKVLPNHDKKIEMILKSIYSPLFYLVNIREFGYSDDYIESETTYNGEMKR